MTGLWDAERDAHEVARALAGLAALLRDHEPAGETPGDAARDEVSRRMLLNLAEDGESAAERVVAYLRRQRAAGDDGEQVAVPPRLGPWRDWSPTRGRIFGGTATAPRRTDGIPRPRRCDPGE
ncbi:MULTISPECIES: hypothetical protein [Actinoplanes]|uniref:hypothetical protein n=1 Tax=Actinoplanes TaxID=1865 RepID=UPI0005F28039|nr:MULTISPECIES: hypothetical protein [Actinoplanes]GLY03552.1 hypothetical protein Acsp01_39310 [Actinoplanes sp. NBRC 101535]